MPSSGRLSIYIDQSLHIEVKVYAARTNQSMSAIVEQALKDYLKKNQK
jgi:predicted HicB family RNase H-like nuclease